MRGLAKHCFVRFRQLEGCVRAISVVETIFGRLARLVARARRQEFACGECERWERCGQLPSEQCIVRAAQLARDADRPSKPAALPYW
jgi:hypothetical protein